jgi:hypothetical protein
MTDVLPEVRSRELKYHNAKINRSFDLVSSSVSQKISTKKDKDSYKHHSYHKKKKNLYNF